MANTKETIKFEPDIRQLRGLFRALNAMEKEANVELKDDVQSITMWMAGAIKTSAYVGARMPAQAAIIAPTVRGNRDRIPNVTIGGSRGRASGGANAGQLLFGNEFGGDRNAFGTQSAFPNGGYKFPPRSPRLGRGNEGYWIFPTLRAAQPEITRRWIDAVEKVFDNWNYGPGGSK
jgi:hypothetical protein